VVPAHAPASPTAKAPSPQADRPGRDELRAFFLSGQGPVRAPGQSGALFPLALDALATPEQAWADWPLIVDGAGEVVRAVTWASRALAGAAVLDGHLPRLVRALGRAVHGRDEPVALAEAVDMALAKLAGEFDLSAKGFEALTHDFDRLRSAAATGAQVVGFGPRAALWLYALAAERPHRAAREALHAEIAELVSHLRELLRNDDRHAPDGAAPTALAAGLGGAGPQLLDAAALAGLLPAHSGTQRLAPDRRARIVSAMETLQDWLVAPRPTGVVVAAMPLPPALAASGLQCEVAPEPVSAARAVFDDLAARAVPVARAWQLARLERGGQWEPRHAVLIDRLDWRAFDGDEWRFVPPVLAVLCGLGEAGAAGQALVDIERTGRPLRVLCTYLASADPSVGLQAAGRALGLLALARPTGMQGATALANPEHLSATVQQLAVAQQQAVVAVAEPAWSADWPWLEAALAHWCRATLCFRWSAAAGGGWADAFDVAGNAAAPAANGRPNEQGSLAHAALVEARLRGHFWFLPGEDEVTGLVPLDSWQEAPDEARRRTLPFVWARDADGTVGRAVVTREMTQAAAGQARWWRSLRELAGEDNPYAARAVAEATARLERDAAAERAELLAERDREVQGARDQATAAALGDLARALLNLDLAAVTDTSPPRRPPQADPVGASAPIAPSATAEPSAAVAAPEPAADAVEEAFVDTALCTSCNDCTNLNPLLFLYDANKQAHIGDLSRGTYLQLVVAAEKCPARCIHPGAPRPGDATATADVVARAAKFN